MSFLFSKQLFHGTPVTIENFLSWKAKFDAELLEIKKKRMKEEEQAGKNKLSGMTPPYFRFPKSLYTALLFIQQENHLDRFIYKNNILRHLGQKKEAFSLHDDVSSCIVIIHIYGLSSISVLQWIDLEIQLP